MIGDPASCEFVTAGSANISVSVRTGLGRVTVKRWMDGRMPLEATPIDGVGDGAVWVPQLNEVIAESNDELCDIAVIGPAPGVGDGMLGDSLRKRIGALCNKVFAMRR
jgi:hypothetical protein